MEETISILYTNAQSVIKKMDELRALIETKKPDVIALTETWSNESIDNDFLSLTGYEIIERKDRADTDRGRGGGILIYVDKKRCAWREEVSGSFCQCGCIKIKGKSRELAVYVVYRSPNSSKTNDEALCTLMRQMNGNCLVLGDFNFPGIRWATGGSDAKGREFQEALEDAYMIQHIDEATHISGSILDLVMTKDDGLVQSVRMEGRLGKSDRADSYGGTFGSGEERGPFVCAQLLKS